MATTAIPDVKRSDLRNRQTPEVASDAHIRVQDVSVRYRLLTEDQRTFKGRVFRMLGAGNRHTAEFAALDHVSLSLNRGEVVGIVGANGSGKSTLLKVFARVLTPATGTVDVRGRLHPMLELGGAFNPYLTGRENVYLYASLFQVSKVQAEALIPDIIDFSGIGEFFDIPMRSYSSGMWTRLAFTVATSVRPEILLVDEILAVGDESFQQKSFARMRRLIETGSLVVIVSHNAASIKDLCTRAVLLHEGKLIEDGRPDDILGAYRRIQHAR